VILGSTLSSTIHSCYSSVYINSPVHETRNDAMTVLICSSAELRRGMFYNVSVTSIEHIIGNYNSILYEYLMDAAFWELLLRRL